MITRVFGTCNGVDVEFSKASEESDKVWSVGVPASESGIYVIDLYADDEAGNSSYFAKAEMVWDSTMLKTTFRIIDIGEGWSIGDIRSIFRLENAGPAVPVTY